MTVRGKTKRVPQGKRLAKAQEHITPVGKEFRHLKMCIYGDNGTGKTTLAATAPKPIIIDCNEKGTDSIAGHPDALKFRVETWEDIDLAYWYLHKGDHDRKTVIIDTVTSLSWLCMKWILGDEVSRDPTRDPDMPTQREYGKLGELMGTQFVQFRNLPMNVIFLAQERHLFADEDSDSTEEITIMPDLSKKPLGMLKAAVGIIGRTTVKEVVVKGKGGKKERKDEFRLYIGKNQKFVAKARRPKGLPPLPKMLKDPDLTELIRALRKGEKVG